MPQAPSQQRHANQSGESWQGRWRCAATEPRAVDGWDMTGAAGDAEVATSSLMASGRTAAQGATANKPVPAAGGSGGLEAGGHTSSMQELTVPHTVASAAAAAATCCRCPQAIGLGTYTIRRGAVQCNCAPHLLRALIRLLDVVCQRHANNRHAAPYARRCGRYYGFSAVDACRLRPNRSYSGAVAAPVTRPVCSTDVCAAQWPSFR
jgi:hypothetical protein